MRPQLCDDIISYFIFESMVRNHKWSTQWRISISTNGTLFDNPGVREFLLKYHKTLALGVSVDGCPTIHNANRSNSMGTILKNWDWYSWYAGTYKTTKSTLNRESIPYLFESLKFLHEELDLHYISQNFIFEPLKETAEDLAEFDRQMEMCVSYVLEHHHDLYWSMIDKHFNAYGCMVHPDDSWCGSGAMPALSTNGKIYGCFRFLPHTSMGTDRDYHIGDVWNGLDHKERFAEIRNQTRRKISPTKCFSCSSESSCAWCVAGAYMETGKFYRQTNICSVQQIQTKWTRIYHERLKSLELGSENQPSILR
jgi:uncharacterized protein